MSFLRQYARISFGIMGNYQIRSHGCTCKLTAWNGLLDTLLTGNSSYIDYKELIGNDAKA